VGIEAISATLQEETDTLVDVVEPYLLKIGMVIRTSSGRRTSDAAYRHLGCPCSASFFNRHAPRQPGPAKSVGYWGNAVGTVDNLGVVREC
jgi:hypothetical protein